MKLTIEQPALQILLARATGVVEKRNTIPILGNVLLSASGSELSVRATDLDIEVISHASAEVAKPGDCTVRADMLSSIVSKLAKGKLVTLSLENGALTVSSGKSTFDLATLPAEDFPVLASEKFESDFQANAEQLARLFNLSAFAMSTEETRYYLQGVYLHSVNGHARAVTTDGHRLAQIDSDITATFPEVIVPRKTVAELRKMLVSGEASVSVSPTKIRVDVGDTQIISKTIDGTFPDYTRVIPTDNDKVARFDAAEMKDAAMRVSLVATERTKSVKLDLEADNVTLSVSGGDGDKGVEDVPADYDGEPMKLAVNSKYLAEVLQHCPGDTVEFKMDKEMTPIVIQPSADDKVLYVLMPMRY